MSERQKIHQEGDALAEVLFQALHKWINGGAAPTAIGTRQVSVILQALAKLAGYFICLCPEEQLQEFADLVKHHSEQARAEIDALKARAQ